MPGDCTVASDGIVTWDNRDMAKLHDSNAILAGDPSLDETALISATSPRVPVQEHFTVGLVGAVTLENLRHGRAP